VGQPRHRNPPPEQFAPDSLLERKGIELPVPGAESITKRNRVLVRTARRTSLGIMRRHFVAGIRAGRSRPPAFAFMRDEGTPAAPSSSMRFSEATAMATSVICALWSASAARHRSRACSGRYRPPPRHANCNQIPAASPCDRARRSAAGAGRAWSARSLPLRLAPRSNVAAHDRRIRMTPADLTVDIVPIVRPIAGKRRNRARNLLQQGTTCEPSIDILVSARRQRSLPCRRPPGYGAFSSTDAPLRRCFSTSHSPGPHMWTAPACKGCAAATVWSVAVICPAFAVRSFDRWPRWVTRIGFQTEQ